MVSVLNNDQSTLDQLSYEVLFKIVDNLDDRSVLTLRRLNRRMYNLGTHFLRKNHDLNYCFKLPCDIAEFIDLFGDGNVTQVPTLTSVKFEADLLLELTSVDIVLFVTRFQSQMTHVTFNLHSGSEGFLQDLNNRSEEFNTTVSHILSGVQNTVEELVLDNYMGLDVFIGSFPVLHTLRINCHYQHRRSPEVIEPFAVLLVQHAPALRQFHLNYTFHRRDPPKFVRRLLRSLGNVNPTCKCYIHIDLLKEGRNLAQFCEYLARENVVCVVELGLNFQATVGADLRNLYRWIENKTNTLKKLVLNPAANSGVVSPVLPKLKVLKELQLPGGGVVGTTTTPTQDMVPVLSKVTLGNLYWTPNDRLDSVTELTLEFPEGDVFGTGHRRRNRWMTRVVDTFPNVRVLTVDESFLTLGELFRLRKVERLEILSSEYYGSSVAQYWRIVASKKVAEVQEDHAVLTTDSNTVRPLADFQNLRHLELSVWDNTELSKLIALLYLSEGSKLKKLDTLVICIQDKSASVRMTERIEDLKKFHGKVIIR